MNLYDYKVLMVIYLVIVSLLLVNMLIAMMANTYDTTNEHKREWIRQVNIENLID